MSSKEDVLFAQLALESEFIDKNMYKKCLQMHTKGETLPISDIMLRHGILTPSQVDTIEQKLEEKGFPRSLPKKKASLVNSSSLTNIVTQTSVPVTSFGRYQILGEIGAGGMGKVYRVHDPKLDRTVALKVLLAGGKASEQQVRRFLREARATAKLDHPNIVRVYDIGNEDGQNFFTMDFIEGHCLKEHLKKSPPGFRQSVDLLIKIGRAIDHAHKSGVIHRDLKPANIMLDEKKEPRVMDFGLAKLTTESAKLSKTGTVMGTLHYMPPEQAEGRSRSVGPRSDVYALGAIMYEMLTRTTPFNGTSSVQLLTQILNKEPIAPRKIKKRIPKELETICLKALAKKQENRYSSAQQFVADLVRFSKGEKVKARRAFFGQKVSIAFRKSLVFFLALLVSSVVGVYLGVFSSHKTEKSSFRLVEARVVNEEKSPQVIFEDQEKVLLELTWEVSDPSLLEEEKVSFHGSGLGSYQQIYQNLKENPRHFYYPVSFVSYRRGRFDLTVQIIAEQSLVEKVLTFETQGSLPPLEREKKKEAKEKDGLKEEEKAETLAQGEITEKPLLNTDLIALEKEPHQEKEPSQEKEPYQEKEEGPFLEKNDLEKKEELAEEKKNIEEVTPQEKVEEKKIEKSSPTFFRGKPGYWPSKLWQDCWNEEGWVDFTQVTWRDVPFLKKFKYTQSYQAWYAKNLKVKHQTRFVFNKIPFVLVFIPPGRFWMGAENEDAPKDQKPRHKVTIKKPFWISKHEVINAQWYAVMQTKPWLGRSKASSKNSYPVVYVTTEDMLEFCRRTQLQLPSEARWEYASRAGTDTPYYWGEKIQDNYLWHAGNRVSGKYANSVGRKLPNAFGLYDMLGNVEETCLDFWADNYKKFPSDGSAYLKNDDSKKHVNRGGSYKEEKNKDSCTCAWRDKSSEKGKSYVGFRFMKPFRE